eukprot:7389497-Pyramimonas_sp.AAC.1
MAHATKEAGGMLRHPLPMLGPQASTNIAPEVSFLVGPEGLGGWQGPPRLQVAPASELRAQGCPLRWTTCFKTAAESPSRAIARRFAGRANGAKSPRRWNVTNRSPAC